MTLHGPVESPTTLVSIPARPPRRAAEPRSA
jgi:hypothetical protein